MNILSVCQDIDSITRRNRVFYKYRRTFHDAMQIDLKKLAVQYGYIGKTEYAVPRGYIDVVWVDKKGNPILAIEIDSSLRAKSVEKLSSLKKEIKRIWVCYSPTVINIEEYENIINGLVMKYEFRFKRK